MSDFDKEAERQKLREKFDRDKEKRKETERMSQLLLQGATMTNRHCDTCGDPLFRYQGQVFCATCEGRAQEADERAQTQAEGNSNATTGEAAAEAGGAEATQGSERTGAAEPTAGAPALDADTTGHTEAQGDGERRDDAERREAAASASERTNAAVDTNTNTSANATPPNTSETRTGPGRAASTAAAGDDALAEARASLIRTLTHHTQQAEAADGPRRATEHLSAAREAAEALAALERGR